MATFVLVRVLESSLDNVSREVRGASLGQLVCLVALSCSVQLSGTVFVTLFPTTVESHSNVLSLCWSRLTV